MCQVVCRHHRKNLATTRTIFRAAFLIYWNNNDKEGGCNAFNQKTLLIIENQHKGIEFLHDLTCWESKYTLLPCYSHPHDCHTLQSNSNKRKLDLFYIVVVGGVCDHVWFIQPIVKSGKAASAANQTYSITKQTNNQPQNQFACVTIKWLRHTENQSIKICFPISVHVFFICTILHKVACFVVHYTRN